MDDERCGEGELTYNTGEVYRGKWSEDKQSMHLFTLKKYSLFKTIPITKFLIMLDYSAGPALVKIMYVA